MLPVDETYKYCFLCFIVVTALPQSWMIYLLLLKLLIDCQSLGLLSILSIVEILKFLAASCFQLMKDTYLDLTALSFVNNGWASSPYSSLALCGLLTSEWTDTLVGPAASRGWATVLAPRGGQFQHRDVNTFPSAGAFSFNRVAAISLNFEDVTHPPGSEELRFLEGRWLKGEVSKVDARFRSFLMV